MSYFVLIFRYPLRPQKQLVVNWKLLIWTKNWGKITFGVCYSFESEKYPGNLTINDINPLASSYLSHLSQFREAELPSLCFKNHLLTKKVGKEKWNSLDMPSLFRDPIKTLSWIYKSWVWTHVKLETPVTVPIEMCQKFWQIKNLRPSKVFSTRKQTFKQKKKRVLGFGMKAVPSPLSVLWSGRMQRPHSLAVGTDERGRLLHARWEDLANIC